MSDKAHLEMTQAEDGGGAPKGDGSAVLTEAARNVDIVHTTLTGLTGIVILLLAAVALPVFHLQPVTHVGAWVVMVLVSMVGIVVLYSLNFRVHKHIADQARLNEVLVNSLGQGFLVFGRDGMCGPAYSQACLDLLETVPAGKPIAAVLGVNGEGLADFEEWFGILFQRDHALGFDDVVKFLPQFFPHSQGRRVQLVYRPIHDKDGSLISVVVIATDLTEEYAAQQQAKKQQTFAEMICLVFKERNQYQAVIAQLNAFLDASADPALTRKAVDPLLRQLHTLKASTRHFRLEALSDVIHRVENDLRDPTVENEEMFRQLLHKGRQDVADALLRVTDDIRQIVGGDTEWRGEVREIAEADLYGFARSMQDDGVQASTIQRYLRTIAAVPMQDCLRPLDRSLQDLARMMDKQVKPLKFTGENPRILTHPLQDFLMSLTHIVRNIMDHGVEAPVTRMARGKDPAGLVTIDIRVVSSDRGDGEWLALMIGDDGNGIDPSKVRAKLSSIDPDGSWRFEDDQTVIQRIFSWGFTTTEAVTAVSGRGVGLEAVMREVTLLGGSLSVSSELYKGCNFSIRIPYKLDAQALRGSAG